MITELDALELQTQCTAYVRRKGWRDTEAEDLASEMLCRALERDGQPLALHYLYLQAREHMEGRRVQEHGQRQWQSDYARTMELHDDLPAPAAPADDPLPLLPHSGSVRAMLLLKAQYGFTQREIAALFGLHESRISLIITNHRHGRLSKEHSLLCVGCNTLMVTTHGNVKYCESCRIERLRYPQSTLSVAARAQVDALRAQGLSGNRIAKHLHLRRTNVYRHLREKERHAHATQG